VLFYSNDRRMFVNVSPNGKNCAQKLFLDNRYNNMFILVLHEKKICSKQSTYSCYFIFLTTIIIYFLDIFFRSTNLIKCILH